MELTPHAHREKLMADPDFARKITPLVSRLFPETEIRVETARLQADDPASSLPDVRVTHLPTGEVVVCADFATQTENRVAALLKLRARLDGN